MSEKKPQLTITISGECGSGKSTLAIKIQDLLAKSGLIHTYIDEDTPMGDIRDTLDQRLDSIRERGTLVKIETKMTRSSPRGDPPEPYWKDKNTAGA